jgi:DNA replication protein DnaC
LSESELQAIDERIEKQKQADLINHNRMMNHHARIHYTSLKEQDWSITLESLEIVDQNKTILQRVAKWTPELKKGVVLTGSVGTGKSTICKAIINRFASPSYRCLFVETGSALNRIQAAINKPDTTVELEMKRLIEPRLLVLDDLGVGGELTPWKLEQIFSIFEARIRTPGTHTWFTTNLTSDQIKSAYTSRFHDRMIEFCSWITFEGESFRKKNFKNEI